VLFPIFPPRYLLGVFAPEVFLLVGYSLPETEPDWVILNESMLEFDCSILLWINSALMALTLPREGFELFSSSFSILFIRKVILLLSSATSASCCSFSAVMCFYHLSLVLRDMSPCCIRWVRVPSRSRLRRLISYSLHFNC